MGLIPGLGRSPVVGNGTPLQYSGLGNSMDRGAWQAIVHGVAKELATKQQCQFYLSSVQSVQFSLSVVSDSLPPHGLQHARPPCPSPTARVYSNSSPLSRWCHSNISPSVVPFSSLQSFPPSGSFPMSQLYSSGGHSIGVSATASVLPNIQD